MKLSINVDCTPQEARAFLGLPDVSKMNETLINEMSKKMSENMTSVEPEALMNNWMAMGNEWQKQMMGVMNQASKPSKPKA